MVNSVNGRALVEPAVEPIAKQQQVTKIESNTPCPLFDSRKASSLQEAAKIIDDGGVVGTPTDTVYAIGASCKHPESIKKIYAVKERPTEKPICLCLSDLDQLRAAKPNFTPLLWSFMDKCYPGGISCVVPKGDWMYNLGVGDAYDIIGTKDSICIRIPDSSVLAYLVSVSGPIAITSGNPSGGADSTHHDMLINSLVLKHAPLGTVSDNTGHPTQDGKITALYQGHKLDGVICDGDSNETSASTVVNCTNIDQGEISYFRIGCTPQQIVDGHFQKAKEEMGIKPPCPLFASKKASSLLQVAEILDKGGVVGTPTDTVYAIGASCKHPDAIRRIYTVKERPSEKPICLCLSSLDQLREASPNFSPLLWNFMERCYPGGISCVVPKGYWMYNLGVGDAFDIVGTKDSICIRIPDSSVLAYLVSVSGPIAITSGNPSGGADSIHHDMLINSLGHKLDAMICDGPSNELSASTVVNCVKIDEGEISYFRIGCTPKEVVDQHFEEAKAEIKHLSEPPCPLFPSKKASSLLEVAEILSRGGVIGTPTDTVYAIGASCMHPESIKRIYSVKERPSEKPICLCLSNLDQLRDANPDFSPLLWSFMDKCYPGGISCVVPKGDWMYNLGVGDAHDIIGTTDSICIRVPDSSVLSYLVSVSGPIAITSGNPSGGADSIHHDMLINSLGHKLDGVICDGDSRETCASTVVNCTKIDQGEVSYFRIGCTPKEVVDKHLEDAKAELHQAENAPPCPLYHSHHASSLRQVAQILDNGGVIGTPTDTVYAIGASCKHPDSIRRIYTVKERPSEKPICLCLSNLDQLRAANPDFSPLLWSFMKRCYPGGISCVVPKGHWMYRLGVGDAYDIIGTKDSICIRVPDSSVLAYLVSVSGPIAITSGNPSGGADSTHHDMVIDSLGHKLDGMICDGDSNETSASTVVNCTHIDEGQITYFRIGCTPQEIVDKHFEDAKTDIQKAKHTIGNTIETLQILELKTGA